MGMRQAGQASAPWLLWVATLGGAAAWSAHLVVGWGLEEIACGSGSEPGTSVLGLPLVAWLIAATVVLGAAAAGAGLLAWRLWRLARAATRDGLAEAWEPRGGGPDTPEQARAARAGFMAMFGLWADGLFLLAIVYGGVSLLYLGPCWSA